ncbi:disintegrin and metalloproteinase domain-containing protein 10-like isoform X3 [Varroa destructor]|uniref:ADAM10 endopeptidase n=1 Tax=Varroa destructor TaxID=109461 RepID=A0A7M7KNW1_VARDE|nr:disintegrin and metalloproteinase domain-containing protein 10-like isoform X3 [Varroa destructor]
MKFKLRLDLAPDEVFARDVEVIEDGRRVWYDTASVVRGVLQGRADSEVQGVITTEGLFDGVIRDGGEEFFIEPAHRYFADGAIHLYRDHSRDLETASEKQVAEDTGSDFQSKKKQYKNKYNATFSGTTTSSGDPIFHSVIYKGSDVRFPQNSSCGSITLDGEIKRHPLIKLLPPSSARQTSYLNRRRKDPSGFHENDSEMQIVETVEQEDDMLRYRQVSLDSTGTHGSSLSGYGIRSVQRTMWVSTERGSGGKSGVVVDPRKTTCMLYLQADHLFFERMGTREACIEAMTRHVHKVNSIYKGTDFDQDGRADNISFLIKRVKVHTKASLHSADYRYPDNYGVEKFLELFSEEDYDAFCLAYMFTYRDFEGGTLGLAWTGDLKNAGGVCEKNGHYRGSLKSLNTGIVTLLNYGKHVPPIVSHVTLAHEIGHSFGSPHDPKDDAICTPGGEAGNYIMFAHATSGDKAHNNRFSPCSLRAINAVLNAKARNLKGCFSEPQWAICGNGVVEEDEECDCGWEDECRESCCVPMGEGAAIGARARTVREQSGSDLLDLQPPCTLRKGVVCSPSQGPCCTAECNLKVGDKCRDDNGCRSSAYCDGGGPKCPPSVSKPNKTICNDEFVCYMGECTGSICTAYGLESCQCGREPSDPPTKACELCCRMPGEGHACKSSFEWNTPPYDVPDLFAKPGTPCDHYNGYCDVFQRCREIDPSGPLATLRKLLLSTRTISSLAQLLSHYAPLVVASALAMFVLFVLALKLLCSLPPGAASTAGSLYYKQAVTANGTNNTEQVSSQRSICVSGTLTGTNQPRPVLRNSRSGSLVPRIVTSETKTGKDIASTRGPLSPRPACVVSSLPSTGTGGPVIAQVAGLSGTENFNKTSGSMGPSGQSDHASYTTDSTKPTAQGTLTPTTNRSITCALRSKLSSLYGSTQRRWV